MNRNKSDSPKAYDKTVNVPVMDASEMYLKAPGSLRRRLYLQQAETSRTFCFADLATAPLIVDAVYEGGSRGGYGDDPLSKLIPGCSNEGGFRTVGGQSFGKCSILVLSSSGVDPDWPDRLDAEAGLYTYYGDNKKPGHGLHDTPKGGNRLLDAIFSASRVLKERANTPPTLVFVKTGKGRSVTFRGLAVPNAANDEGLIAIWRQTSGRRFQNYRSTFAILDCREIPRDWLVALASQDVGLAAKLAPPAWSRWVTKGTTDILHAPKTIQHRSKEQQLPEARDKTAVLILNTIREAVKATPHDFEFLAAEIFQMIEPRVFGVEITRKSADGGRDATGRLRIGGEESESDAIFSEFALEAKAYAASNSVGVKETSRLISRLRQRQFGVIVTTSYVATQAYKELRDDNHPVIIIAAADIARILRRRGIATKAAVLAWIENVLGEGRERGV
jgi:hypothetical protein